MALHGYNTRRSLFALDKNPTPLKRQPIEEDEDEEEEGEKSLPILVTTHDAARAVRMKQEDKHYMFSGDEKNAKAVWKSILQTLRVTLRTAHPDYVVILDTSRNLPPGQYFQPELLRHLYDVLNLITKGKAHGLITTDGMETIADGRLALVMINEVVSPFDQHRARELTQAVAMMEISAKEPPAAQMQHLVSMREELCVVSGDRLPDGQLVKDLLNAISYEFEVTRRVFRDVESPNLHHVQREITDEYNAIRNRQKYAGVDNAVAFAAETRAIRFPETRNRVQGTGMQVQRPGTCFICDGSHHVNQCSWLPTVRDMVKKAMSGASLSHPNAAAVVDEGAQEEGSEDHGCGDDTAFAIAAEAVDEHNRRDAYDEEDWLQSIAT